MVVCALQRMEEISGKAHKAEEVSEASVEDKQHVVLDCNRVLCYVDQVCSKQVADYADCIQVSGVGVFLFWFSRQRRLMADCKSSADQPCSCTTGDS